MPERLRQRQMAEAAGQVGDGQEEMEDMEVMLHARHLKDERLEEIVVECGTRNVLSTFW